MVPPPPRRTEERLQKILSQAGIASRRGAEELLRDGRVTVNGKTVTELGTKANPRTDQIKIDGRPLRLPSHHTYILLHKPTGVVTTMSDPEGRPTVAHLLSGVRARVFPVGRLDFHSSGLLLLTDDGDLALRLTHPRYGVIKAYIAKVSGSISEKAMQRLARGVRLDDGTRCAPVDVRVLETRDEKTWLELILAEGRNREVRRMCEAVGYPVDKLRRVRLGPLKLGKLAAGVYRELNVEEIIALRRSVGLDAE